jgi:hypothetical protein
MQFLHHKSGSLLYTAIRNSVKTKPSNNSNSLRSISTATLCTPVYLRYALLLVVVSLGGKTSPQYFPFPRIGESGN